MLRRMVVYSFFYTFRIKEECKEDYMKMGESKVGLDNRIVKRIMCSLEGGYASEGSLKKAFQRCVRCTEAIDRVYLRQR